MVRNRTALTACLSLIPILLLGAFLCRYDNRRGRAEPFRFWHDKVAGRTECELLVLGDSRTVSGVSPTILREYLPGRDAYNLAFLAGGLNPEIYREAEARLAAQGDNRIVLVGCTPLSLTESSARNKHLHEIQENWLYRAAPDIMRVLSSFFASVQVPEFVDAAGGVRRRFEYHADGWRPQNRFPPTTKYHPPMPIVSEHLREDLLAAVARWSDAGIAVFVFNPPTTVAGSRARDTGSGYDQARFAERVEAAGGRWLEANPEDYECIDGSHLSQQASIALSHDLGRAMARSLAGRG